MFKFNGIDLELYVKVIEISKPMLSRTNYCKENPSRHGTSYQGYKYNDKDITNVKERTTISAYGARQ